MIRVTVRQPAYGPPPGNPRQGSQTGRRPERCATRPATLVQFGAADTEGETSGGELSKQADPGRGKPRATTVVKQNLRQLTGEDRSTTAANQQTPRGTGTPRETGSPLGTPPGSPPGSTTSTRLDHRPTHATTDSSPAQPATPAGPTNLSTRTNEQVPRTTTPQHPTPPSLPLAGRPPAPRKEHHQHQRKTPGKPHPRHTTGHPYPSHPRSSHPPGRQHPHQGNPHGQPPAKRSERNTRHYRNHAHKGGCCLLMGGVGGGGWRVAAGAVLRARSGAWAGVCGFGLSVCGSLGWWRVGLGRADLWGTNRGAFATTAEARSGAGALPHLEGDLALDHAQLPVRQGLVGSWR